MILNPIAGRAKRTNLADLKRIAHDNDAWLEILPTSRAGEAGELAQKALTSGADLIIAAGGDGTINEVINGLVRSTTPLGIIPLGTANVLARETGLPMNPEEALMAALQRKTRSISLGRIESGKHARYFTLMAGAGFDAMVVKKVNTRIKKYIGKLAYVLKAAQCLIKWNSSELQVLIDGNDYTCQTIIVCNARKYGGSFVLAPGADIREPEFHAVMLTGKGRLRLLRFALAFAIGRHMGLSDLSIIKGKHIAISGVSPVQIDGDNFGPMPVSISMVADALRLVY